MKRLLLPILLVCFHLSFAQINLTAGLVAYYPFNGNANDASGNGNNGIVTNASLTADRLGNANSAYYFNGSNASIRVPNSASLNVGSQITITAQVKIQGFYMGPCHGNSVVNKGDYGYVTGYTNFGFDDGQYTAYQNCSNATVDVIHQNFYGPYAEPPQGPTQYMVLNQWYCMIYTYDGTTAKMYIDGNLIASVANNPGATFNNPYDLYLGKHFDPAFQYWFNGVMDEVRIYNRAINTAEVGALCSCVTLTITNNPSNVTVCAGSNATFSIAATNATNYQWQVNTGAGWTNVTNNATYAGASTNTLNITGVSVSMNNYQYRDSVSSACTNAISSPATLFVTTPVTPAVSITTPTNPICAGIAATFTATPVNGGTTPAYQWQKNGINVGTNSPNYTDNSLANNDIIKVKLTTNLTCVTASTAFSNAITMTVNPIVTPTAAISGSANNICATTPVTFTANITSGGTTPTYQWQKNGANVGANAATYSDNALANGDIIKLVLTSNAPCTTAATVSSNSITMVVNPLVTPAISITSPGSSICPGTSVSFTATATNGGSSPSYQWTKNGVNAGTNSTSYTDNNLTNGDVIKATLTSNANCTTATTAVSNSITMIVTNTQAIRYPTINAVNQPTQLLARVLPGATNYLWTPPTGLSNNTIYNPTFTSTQQVEYTIRISLGGTCQVTDTLLVTVFKNKNIYVPEGFSPNGDGRNDKLYPILVGIARLNYFRVYNRWGNLLFETTSSSPAQGWDGTFKGNLQPVETYTWIAEGVDIDGLTIKRGGNTLLLR